MDELMKKYPDMDYGSKIKSRKTGNEFGFLPAAEANQKKLLELQAMLEKAQNPVAQERIKNEIAKLQGKDAARVPNTYGRGGTADMQEYMRTKDANRFKPAPTPETPEPILDGDDEKKGFFDRLLSKENRPFLENLGMQLGTTLTAPMNPGENRSLINQVATSIQGASDKTAADEKADVAKLLATAQAKKAFSEADGGTDLYKKAVEYVTSLYPNIKSTDPAYGKYLAQAMNKFGVKDITTAQVNAFVKLSQMESELAMFLDKDSDEYKKKALEIDAFKKRLDEGGIGGSSGDGRTIVKFEDVQSGD